MASGSGSLVTSSDCTTSLAGAPSGSTSYRMAATARCAKETRRTEDNRTACPAGETHSAWRRLHVCWEGRPVRLRAAEKGRGATLFGGDEAAYWHGMGFLAATWVEG